METRAAVKQYQAEWIRMEFDDAAKLVADRLERAAAEIRRLLAEPNGRNCLRTCEDVMHAVETCNSNLNLAYLPAKAVRADAAQQEAVAAAREEETE